MNIHIIDIENQYHITADIRMFKACICYFFIKFLFVHQMIALWKLWKIFFISSEKHFLFSRYSDFCSSVFQSFSPSQPLLQWLIYDATNCLWKNITYFVWYVGKEKRYDIESLSIDRVLNKEHFYGKIMQKMCSKS